MTPRLRRQERSLVALGVTVMVVAATIVGVTALHRARVAFENEHDGTFAVGDCVVVPSAETNEVRAQRASCTQDPSYTVGAMIPSASDCPSPEYQRFSADVADDSTAGLCLVPNLVAEHCYLMQLPFGAMQRADCEPAAVNPAGGLLVQVTQRLDIHDRRACPNAGNQYVWPYPSPQRTYCTRTFF
ncbi:hypothetical protein [Mycolicibacterium mengxianglii]|uniref:hypothetical protein n=1 Tax=Mycolicibacterium mengxianglii TaxID=2736649 RepID=UPI001E39B682|nr:hypothetical protein [Mycolicibacterium mengxianglii]